MDDIEIVTLLDECEEAASKLADAYDDYEVIFEKIIDIPAEDGSRLDRLLDEFADYGDADSPFIDENKLFDIISKLRRRFAE